MLVLLLLLKVSTLAIGQDKIKIKEEDYNNQQVEMADGMRASGKIYVVVAAIVSIFAGLVVYTVIIDRKITKLEKED